MSFEQIKDRDQNYQLTNIEFENFSYNANEFNHAVRNIF